ncbi:MAG: hypothetical protein HY925_00475 [Elusimicrobia bacterium]|nr:hypothetical protein [Elusimicrobiota bacterium]
MIRALLILGIGTGIFLLIAYPKFKDLERYVVEGTAKGNLGVLRQNVEAHRTNTGRLPEKLGPAGTLWDTKIYSVPHPPTSAVVAGSTASARDTGGYGYDSAAGVVFIDCTHTDSRGSAWTSY